jgi:hypothetical protein
MLRFRTHQIAFTANIEMYQQIGFFSWTQDCNEYCRVSSDTPIQTYKLPTVPYGTALKPFLVTACLKNLEVEEREKYPQITAVLFTGFL